MRSLFTAVLLCFAFNVAQGSTIPVAPTGSCAGDMAAIQNAINSAQPRDVVQLAAGTYDFSCLTADNPIIIRNTDIMIQGSPDGSVLVGPPVGTESFSPAFFVAADGVTFDTLQFQNFFPAVQAGSPTVRISRIAITNSQFRNNPQAIRVAPNTLSAQIVGNTFVIPAPISADIFSDFGESFGVVLNRHCSNLLFAKNTLTGPGVAAHFQNTDQLIADPSATGVGLRTIGLLQTDFSGDVSELGRVSDNTFSGLDLGMQASSNMGVITHNNVTGNAIGITLSNDFDDGVHQVTQSVITENVASGNEVGIWIASGSNNTITLNDVRDDSLAGVLFLANPGGAPSTGNFFHQNLGGKIVGAKGNTGF
jgi:parallel beta-helix repeat protein